MKTQTHLLSGRIVLFIAAIVMLTANVPAQTIRNNGTLNNTGTTTCNILYNYKTGSPGTVNNTGTFTVANLIDNNFSGSVINNNAAGTFEATGATSDFSNGVGTTSNSTSTSVVKIGNTLTLGAGTFTTSAGEVQFTKAGAQTIPSGVAGSAYAKITTSGGSGTKSLGGTIAVSDVVTIGAGTTFDIGANTLTLTGATPLSVSGTLTASTAGATVVYSRSGNQDVAGGTYDNLTLSTAGTKTATGSVTVNAGLANSVTFDLGSNALNTGASASVTNTGGTIQTAGNVTFGTSHTIAGTFIYQNSTTSQSIGTASYATLTLSGGSGATGQKNFPAGTVGVSGTYSVSGATRNYGSGTFVYNGSTAQSVLGGESYNNLTISGAADTSATNYKAASATLSVGGVLTVSSGNTLDMSSYSSSTFGGGSSNSGKLMWSGSNVYVSGTGTTEFYGPSAATVAAGSAYGNIWFTGSGIKTIAGSVTATGGTAAFGVTVANNMTVNGDLTITGMDLNVSGNITNNGTITVQ